MKWSGLWQDLGADANVRQPDNGPGYMRIKADPEEEIPGELPSAKSSKWQLPGGWRGEEKAIPVASAVDPEISPEREPEELQEYEMRWKDLADRGELCVYTCLSFKIGGRSDVSSLAPTLIALVALQVMVPALMLFHEMKAAHSAFRSSKHLEFRIVGFILYLYSIRSMFNNCVGECRAIFLEMAFQYNLPFPYVWPLVLGELINSFCSFTLCLTLFTVFCQADQLQDLVINCIAINFIGNVDSEFCSEELKDYAVVNFQAVVREHFGAGEEEPETCARSMLEDSLAFFLWMLRTICVLGFGTFLAFVFLLSNQVDFICERIPLPVLC